MLSPLQQDFMPLPTAFVDGMLPSDRFVLAFPRSGSRWLRLMLEDLNQLARGEEMERYNELALLKETGALLRQAGEMPAPSALRLIPDAHIHGRDKSLLASRGQTPIFRSHHLAEVLLRCQGRLVYLFREPAPMFFSFFHFARQRAQLPQDHSLESFCENRLPLWIDHMRTMLQARAEQPGRVLFVDYHDDGPFTPAQLVAVARHLDLPTLPEAAAWAVDRLREYLKRLNANAETLHARGGNDARARMPEPLRQWLEELAGPVFEQARAAANADVAQAFNT